MSKIFNSVVVLVVMGIFFAAYHYGYLDSYLSKANESADVEMVEGPSVRREVAKLTLPLESSRFESAMRPAEEVNETDISEDEYNTSAARVDSVEDPKTEEIVAVKNDTVVKKDISAKESSPVSEAEQPDKDKSASVNATEPEKDVAGKKDVAAKTAAPKKKKDAAKVKVEAAKAVISKPAAKKSRPQSGVVGEVKVKCSNNQLVLTIPVFGGIDDMVSFSLKKPDRLVVDLKGRLTSKAKSLYRLEGCAADKVVVGEHKNKIRFVVHLTSGVKASISKISKEDKQVVVIIKFGGK